MSRSSAAAQLKKELAAIDKARAVLNTQADAIRTVLALLESDPDPMPTASRDAQMLRDAMHDVLSVEHPLHRKVIYERLVEKGVAVNGRNPVNNVGAHLSADDRFKSLGKGMWDLEDRPAKSFNDEQHDELNDSDASDPTWLLDEDVRPIHAFRSAI